MIQGHYPSSTTVIADDSIIHGIREERLCRKNGMASLTVQQLINSILHLKINLVDNRNIADRCIGRKGPHLNFSETIQLAENFVNFIKKI